MSMEAHLVELKRRHSVLEQEIAAAAGSPGASPLEVAALKRRKLVLKDQIARLSLSRVEH